MEKKLDQNELKALFSKYDYKDSAPDVDQVWNKRHNEMGIKEDYMSEKKGGMKIIVWLVSFMVIVAVGWFGLNKVSTLKKQEKIEKGEAIVVTLIVGKAEVKKQGSTDWREMAVEDTLQMGDTVRTSQESYCELQMVKRGIFRVESSSELYLATLVSADDKVTSRMKLNKGGIALKPNKLKEGEKFEVETATAVAAVRGTKFSVSVSEAGDTQVAVNEGMVAMSPVLPSIDEAKDKGTVDQGASEILKEQVVKPIEVTPGQEVKMEKAKVDALDEAVGKAIEKTVAKEGTITAEKLTQEAPAPVKTEGAKQAPQAATMAESIVAQVKQEVIASAAPDMKASEMKSASILDVIAQKQEISEDAKKKLDTLSEDKIIDKVVDMIRIRFESKPDKSDIFVDGVNIGQTPMDAVLEKGKKVTVRIAKEGFNEMSKEIDVNSSFTFNTELTAIAKAVETNTNTVAVVSNTNTVAVVEEAKKLPGDLEWEKPLPIKFGAALGEPIFIKGKIYSVVNNKLVILSSEGKVLKTVSIAEDGVNLTRAVYSDNQIYVGSENGGLYAISAAGELLWKKDAGSQKFGAGPAAGFGIVAVPSLDKGMQVYSKSGDLLANIDISVPIYSAPLIVNEGKMLVYATESGEVVAYDLENKTKKWTQNYNERFLYPLVGDSSIIITLSRNSGKIMGLNPVDGSVKWNSQFAEIQKTKINPQFVNGRLVLANNSTGSTVVIVNGTTGATIAKTTLGEPISVPFMVGDIVYIGTEEGKVYAYNIGSRKMDWINKSGKSVALVVGDKDGVYAVSSGSFKKLIK